MRTKWGNKCEQSGKINENKAGKQMRIKWENK